MSIKSVMPSNQLILCHPLVVLLSIFLCISAFSMESVGRRQWHPTPVLLPGKSNGQRSLVGCSPRGHEESDTTEQLHFPFSLSCIGEGNATQSSVLAWRIPGTAEPGGLPSMRSHRIGRNWSDLAAAAAWSHFFMTIFAVNSSCWDNLL